MALMRLINTTTLQLEEHWDTQVSKLPGHGYAILSHCWSGNPSDEVSYNDITSEKDVSQKPGYGKLKVFCELALSQGYGYAWMDTACINKDSATELSTALVSMYRWYAEAGICIAHLGQVGAEVETLEEDKWFTRGWTLQELIAPKNNMCFYDHAWEVVGKKADLLQRLSARTKIPASVLNHDAQLKSCSIAQRMSWAANRETSRIEDRAYSLLGIFDVSLEMVYGERERAFLRLQERIVQHNADQSIFYWTLKPENSPSGLLASSPDAFANCHNVVANDISQAFSWENIGLVLDLPTLPYSIDTYLAFVRCNHKDYPDSWCAILIGRLSERGQWARVAINDGRSVFRHSKDLISSLGTTSRRICVRQEQDASQPPVCFRRTNGFWFRTLEPPHHQKCDYQVLSRSGAAVNDRVYLAPGLFGHAGIVHFTPHKASSGWSQIKWVCVGFDDEFRPVVMVANSIPTVNGRNPNEQFRKAVEAGPESEAHKGPFSSGWIRSGRLADAQEEPTFKNAWRKGYCIIVGRNDIREGAHHEVQFEALNLKIRMSLLEDFDPVGKKRGAVVGPQGAGRYVWTLDFELTDIVHRSPEGHHCGEICCAGLGCVVGWLFAPLGCGMCLAQAKTDCDEVCG